MRFFFLCLVALAMSQPSAAQAPARNGDAPVEISAAGALEWNRLAKTYTATGDALAKQGDMSVTGDKMTAVYDDAGGDTAIRDITAEGHVVVTSPPYKAYGDRAVYTVSSGNAVMTGNDLRIETPAEKLTARDKIEFFGAENKMVATGNAVAVRAIDTIKADVMTATFSEDAAGKMQVDQMTADGNVTIITARETVTGDRGVYDIRSEKAVLTGRVRILQGQNWLEGTRADINLKTGISKLYADQTPAADGRVKGVFYPKSRQE